MINLNKVSETVSSVNKGKMAAAMIVGAGVGFLASMIVNSCLLEVSINGFFTFYFFIILTVVGGLMVFRNKQREQNDQQPQNIEETFMRDEKKQFLTYASWLVVCSGVLCLFLEKNWNKDFPYVLKTPIYIVVAMALTYLVTFAIVDFVNFGASYFQTSGGVHAVESEDQVLALLLNCFACGMLYGLVFSLMDVEDANYNQIKARFLYEEYFCLPIGIMGGAVGGAINEVLRSNVKCCYDRPAEYT